MRCQFNQGRNVHNRKYLLQLVSELAKWNARASLEPTNCTFKALKKLTGASKWLTILFQLNGNVKNVKILSTSPVCNGYDTLWVKLLTDDELTSINFSKKNYFQNVKRFTMPRNSRQVKIRTKQMKSKRNLESRTAKSLFVTFATRKCTWQALKFWNIKKLASRNLKEKLNSIDYGTNGSVSLMVSIFERKEA